MGLKVGRDGSRHVEITNRGHEMFYIHGTYELFVSLRLALKPAFTFILTFTFDIIIRVSFDLPNST